MGEPTALLLGERLRRAVDTTVHRRVRLRLRVHGSQRPTGHHAANRPNLSDTHAGAVDEAGRGSGRTGRHWENGDYEGPGQGSRTVVYCYKLR